MRNAIPIALVCSLGVNAQQWVQLPDFPGTARDDAASFVIGEHIYVGTGMEVGWGLTTDWHHFNGVTQVWSTAPQLPATPRQYCSTFVVDGRGYVFGGLDANGPLGELWRYDPASDTWTARAPLPGTPRYAATAWSRSGLGYVHGGVLPDGGVTDELWLYNPGTDQWTLLNMPQMAELPARHRSTVLEVDGHALLAGGMDAQGGPARNTFLQVDNGHGFIGEMQLPEARFGARGAADVLIGGATSFSMEHADVWRFQLGFGWDTQALPPFAGGPRRGGVAAAYTQGDVHVVHFGLGLHQGERFKDWWRLAVPVTTVEERKIAPLTVFPNPATDRITIRSNNALAGTTCRIHDALGRCVMLATLPATGHLDIGHLSHGRYELLLDHGHVRHRASFIKLP